MLSKEQIEKRATKLREVIGETALFCEDFDPATLIARGIEMDIGERAGLRDAWNNISVKTQREIRSLWREFAKQVICLSIIKA